MSFNRLKILSLSILLTISLSVFGENFGRNKVQYQYRHWEYFETAHFIIYYSEGYEEMARRGADVLENSYSRVSIDLAHYITEPLPVIIYPSPGAFQQNNITMSILGEGTGGFTESFKTRVVLPFNGSYEDYRHVLVHEMAHAITFDLLLGRGPSSLISTNRIFRQPLWMAEGISEWESICWDVESDMYLRDAILNDYVVPLSRLQGFLAYKEGASVIGYIARRYGRQKIGEIIGKGIIHLTGDLALTAAIGKDQNELYEDWLITKKREYFPEFAVRDRPEDIAEMITDHEEEGSYFNVMPAFSPDGYRVAYISNRDDYIDLFVEDIITGNVERIARGERSGEAESFHPFRSRPGWSFSAKYLAYSRKHQGKDQIAIRETEDWKIYYVLDLEEIVEISSPAFIPGDSGIVFTGLQGDQSDLFFSNFSGNFRKLTDDLWDDKFPTVSPNGRYIAFSSDRPTHELFSSDSTREQAQIASEKEELKERFGCYNIWIMDIIADTMHALTTDGLGNDHPNWSPDGNSIAFTSERNGIRNIWIATVTDSVYMEPYTDLISGAFTPSWENDNSSLIFSAYYKGGFDIYHLKKLHSLDSLTLTPYAIAKDTLCPVESSDFMLRNSQVFRGDIRNLKVTPREDELADFEQTKSKPYKPQFSVDLVSGALGYDTFYGMMGYTYLMFSDVLGNQQILFTTDLLDDIENSTFYLNYSYLAHRLDFGFSAFYYKDYFWDNQDRIFSDRVYGGSGFISYPFNQFDRAQFSINGFQVDREFLSIPSSDEWPDDIAPVNLKVGAALVKDNSLWTHTGPIAGTRAKVAFEWAPKTGDNSMDFYAGRIDYRKYHHFGDGYAIAYRLAGGAARGNKPPQYWMGGSDSWLNYDLASDDIYSIRDIYFSRMILPLRGHEYFAYTGQTYAMINLEIRYPLIQYLRLGFPPIEWGGVNGVIFTDIGGVTGTDLQQFRGWEKDRFDDIKMGIGFGARAWIWMFLFRYDMAWETNIHDIADKPTHHISIGADF